MWKKPEHEKGANPHLCTDNGNFSWRGRDLILEEWELRSHGIDSPKVLIDLSQRDEDEQFYHRAAVSSTFGKTDR